MTRRRLYLETMQDVLSRNRKVYSGDSGNVLYLPVEGQGSGAAAAPADLQRFPGAAAALPKAPDSSRDLRPVRSGREEPRR